MNYLALAALEKNAANFLGVDLAVEPWSSRVGTCGGKTGGEQRQLGQQWLIVSLRDDRQSYNKA